MQFVVLVTCKCTFVVYTEHREERVKTGLQMVDKP